MLAGRSDAPVRPHAERIKRGNLMRVQSEIIQTCGKLFSPVEVIRHVM